MTIPRFITCKRTYVIDWCTRVKIGEKVEVLRHNEISAQLVINGTPIWCVLTDIRDFFEGWTE